MINVKAIAYVQSPFKEKFGIPRQAGLTPSVPAILIFEKEYSDLDAFRELEGFSHIWVTFYFHKFNYDHFQSVVRPPRLGGNEKIGVFATRSPNRPNALGLSKVKIQKIEKSGNKVHLHVFGLDALDGTPILDIRPFIEEDSEHSASFGWTKRQIKNECYDVSFSQDALLEIEASNIPNLKNQIIEVLRLDPSPQYKETPSESFGMNFYHFNIKWIKTAHNIHVTQLEIR
ncbi:methyltransferase, YaeB family [Bacteriovorax sp. BSW11_IV]|uniref:tRNA (N6-threonylcarbamoyladenosine(37)-N6)-methyltransferase TrmO n=1 Tax=Bacteriovorax sp. BSW11_IV TaxID=1353529 RepID=UPI00038A30F9|nr:tRNA (N6-threonylcarbamoyladenosine(37)-N6)-methyltransferase TrmO [Bacteriovorax sp. BSW11_IV]EQC50158.1 methyltransferase, YaeB family [Bacteriovorax sp. BSW11_IV]